MSAAHTDTTRSGVRRGLFVVLDGVDGCGKSTQARRLVEALSAEAAAAAAASAGAAAAGSASTDTASAAAATAALHVREPGSTRVGEALRAIVLGREHDLDPRVETLLFAAARAQMLVELVEPALALGRDVVCERFHPSTFAYQAVAGGLDERHVLELLERFAGRPKPDVVIVLDVEPDKAAARRPAASDRIEDKGLEFQRAVARGYRRYADLVPDTIVIDGARDEPTVARDILSRVNLARSKKAGGRAPR